MLGLCGVSVGDTHLCVEAEAHAHLPGLLAVAVEQVAVEAWQWDGGSGVGQEHVGRGRHNEGVCHGT